MRILIVEDDENKRNHLVSFLHESLPDVVLETAASYNSGMRKLVEWNPDLIILDMTLPIFDISATEHGGGSELYGGREILEQMDYRNITIPVIVVTQFDRFGDPHEAITLEQLDRQLGIEYRSTYRGSVFYNSAREGWKSSLKRRMIALDFWRV